MKPKDIMRSKLRMLVSSSDKKIKNLSDQLGFAQQSAVSKLLAGTANIKSDHIPIICAFFGVSTEWFMDGDPASPVAYVGSASFMQDEELLKRQIKRMGITRALDVLTSYASWPVPPPNVTISPLLPTRIEYSEPDPKAAEAAQNRAIREAKSDAKAEARGEGARPGGSNGKTPKSG